LATNDESESPEITVEEFARLFGMPADKIPKSTGPELMVEEVEQIFGAKMVCRISGPILGPLGAANLLQLYQERMRQFRDKDTEEGKSA
jgi:hypothetical protein